jgi:cysteinyl-tRNA synthetase
MQSHYRKNLVFSWENLDNAKIAYGKLVQRIAQLGEKAEDKVDEAAFAAGKKKFTDALDNDLNTSLAVTAIYDVFKLSTNDKTKLALIKDFERVMSLGLIEAADRLKEEARKQKEEENAGVDPELLEYINKMIEARRAAKAEKNFAEADRIKAELLEKGITLLDTREGTKFKIGE